MKKTQRYAALALLLCSTILGLQSCGDKKPGGDNGLKGDPVKGKQLYGMNCATCHGPGGKGDGPAAAAITPKPADHTNKAVIGERNDETLANIIKMGGGIVGKPTMPASPQYSDQDLADLVAYLRQISGSEHH